MPVKERSSEELYRLLISRSKKLERSVFNLIQSFVMLAKSNGKDLNALQNEAHFGQHKRELFILQNIIIPYAKHYEEMKTKRGEIDFTDAIIQAAALCHKGLWRKYKYILVDEFQDISVDRYKFLLALRNEYPQTKLFCVGDDWQSIYRFSGSDMSLFYNFEEYFGFTEKCKIETTYRFHAPVIQRSSEFIQRNPEQLKKNIHSPKPPLYSELFENHVVEVKNSDNGKELYIDGKLTTPTKDLVAEIRRAWKAYPQTFLDFVPCMGDKGTLEQVKRLLTTIPLNESVIVIGRYNYDARSLGFDFNPSQENLERITVSIDGRSIQFMSCHAAKGLEADHVLLINCNQGMYGFSSLIEDDPLLDFVLSKQDQFEYAEERRLFYVAITRAKKHMYVLYDAEHPSTFVEEFTPSLQPGQYKCPICMEGEVVKRAEGTSKNGQPYTFYACNNQAAHCDYHIMMFGRHEHPGVLIK